MARIRSIHPGLFTDEAFMSVSVEARILLIGIWTEAFDDGVFEWKPLTLKARIFPVNDVDVRSLLSELVNAQIIASFEEAGKTYGAVRNFQKYQRPKKPNSSGVLPDQLRSYVCAPDQNSEPVPNQFPTNGEKSPQMEDGGGNRREEEKEEKKETVALTAPQPAPASPKISRGRSLPEDWEPNDKHFEFALSKSLSPDWVRSKAVDMREWAMANRNRAVARKADWDLTFLGWIRRESEKAQPSRPNHPSFANRQEPSNGNRIINSLHRIGAQLEDLERGGFPPARGGFAN